MSQALAPDSLRFRPPATAFPTAARWALRRAFGPIEEEDRRAPAEAAAWASRLGLVERIAARSRGGLLAAELGPGAADDFVAAKHRTAARNLALRELAARVIAIASGRGIEVWLLKGMALLEEIPGLDQCRPLADVDLLVEDTAAPELSLALESTGLERATVHESSHHLPALYHPDLGTLELHVHLPGVARADEDAVTAAALAAAGRGRRAVELAPAWIPAREILAAHALAHAVAQSAHSPRGYPLLRLIADLIDLGAAERSPRELIEQAAPWLGGSVSTRELAAIAGLCRELTRGDFPAAGSDPRRIVDHVVAAHLDRGYLRSLEIRALGAAIRRRDWLKVRRRAARPANLPRLFRVGWSWLSHRLRRGGAAEGL